MPKRRKAVALISGGLDSMLAARVIMDQGIDVEGVNFFTGFCVEGHTHAIRERKPSRPKRNNALWAAEQLGIKLHIIDVIDEYKDVLLRPKHGYGSNLNPCLDCKVFMVKRALELGVDDGFMDQQGFDFIITGEVVGQRPKSQRKDTMPLIACESGAEDRLLRPLSARLLPETLPEREGWVCREKLHGFHGRNRKPQIELARRFGINDWAQPAGGCCFLTDPSYSAKLSDLWRARGERAYELDDVMLLKVGRHLRPAPHYKLIIGREEGENRYLEGYRGTFLSLTPVSHRGPVCLVDGELKAGDLETAASVLARYTQGRDAVSVTIAARSPDGSCSELKVAPRSADAVSAAWLLGA